MTWWLSEAYGKSRYSADVYNSTAPWTKAQKNSSKSVKTTKGYFRNEHLVTHKFHGTKSTPTTNKANQFNIKIGGVERVFYNLSSEAFGDLIMKQAEYYNAMNELNNRWTEITSEKIIDAFRLTTKLVTSVSSLKTLMVSGSRKPMIVTRVLM